jgi:hypothetical protein
MDRSFLMYMYEPLWDVEKSSIMSVYHRVFTNAIKSVHPSFIIYVSGITNSQLDDDFFTMYGYKQVNHLRVLRGIGWNGNHIYLYERGM